MHLRRITEAGNRVFENSGSILDIRIVRMTAFVAA